MATLQDIFSAQESIKPPKKEIVSLSPQRIKEIDEVNLENKITFFLSQHPKYIQIYPTLKLTDEDTLNGTRELPSVCGPGGQPKIWYLGLAYLEMNNWEVSWGEFVHALEEFTQKEMSEQSAKNHLTKACKAMFNVFHMDIYYNRHTNKTQIRTIEERSSQLNKHMTQAEKGLKLLFKDVMIVGSSKQELPEDLKYRLSSEADKLNRLLGYVNISMVSTAQSNNGNNHLLNSVKDDFIYSTQVA
jgi:hypothetical protein